MISNVRISAEQRGSDVLVWKLLLDSPDPDVQGLVLKLNERTEQETVVRGSHLPGRTGSCFQLHDPSSAPASSSVTWQWQSLLDIPVRLYADHPCLSLSL